MELMQPKEFYQKFQGGLADGVFIFDRKTPVLKFDQAKEKPKKELTSPSWKEDQK